MPSDTVSEAMGIWRAKIAKIKECGKTVRASTLSGEAKLEAQIRCNRQAFGKSV